MYTTNPNLYEPHFVSNRTADIENVYMGHHTTKRMMFQLLTSVAFWALLVPVLGYAGDPLIKTATWDGLTTQFIEKPETLNRERARESSTYDVLEWDNSVEITAMHNLAAARGWDAVSEDELQRARATEGSLRAALGSDIIMVVADHIYRIPSSDIQLIPENITGSSGSFDALPARDVFDAVSIEYRESLDNWERQKKEKEVIPYSIVNNDDRVPVPPLLIGTGALGFPVFNVIKTPFRQLARIVLGNSGITAANGCSGAFFGPRHVLTSGHCFNPVQGIFPVNTVSVAPSASGSISRTPSNAIASFIIGTGDADDIALIVLPDIPAVTQTGFYGWQLSSTANENSPVSIRGYPGAGQFCFTNPLGPNPPFCGDMAGNRILYETTCSLTEVDQELEYPCDTSGGMSGAPVVRNINNLPRITGVHKGTDDDALDDENRGVRLTNFNVSMLCGFALSTPSATVPFTCGL